MDRDGHCCVLCGATQSLQLHHRRPRGLGGTSDLSANLPANLLLLCLTHHAEVESHREWALQHGYLVRQGTDPASVPLLYGHDWVRLTDDATIVLVVAA
jgi:5-methylcytosine-specific restriction protein A